MNIKTQKQWKKLDTKKRERVREWEEDEKLYNLYKKNVRHQKKQRKRERERVREI